MKMIVRLKLLFVIAMVLFGILYVSFNGLANGTGGMSMISNGYVPQEGFVPDEETAILIARAVLIKIYGQQKINSEEPLHAELKDGVWTVQGTLKKDFTGGGGVAIIKLSKSNGCVLYVIHEK